MNTDAITTLTPRQRAILDYLSHGFTLQHAASELGISFGTARIHRHRAYQKLGLVGLPNPGLRALCLYGRFQAQADSHAHE